MIQNRSWEQVKRQVTHPLEALRLLQSEKGVGEANGVKGGDAALRFASKKQSRAKTFGEFFASKASQRTCTAGTENESKGGIWKYTTLSWWWVWFKQVRFQKSTLTFATAALVHGRPCAAAICEGFLDNAMQKKTNSCVLWYLPTKSRKDNVSEVLKTTYKYQSVPDPPATATQLSY